MKKGSKMQYPPTSSKGPNDNFPAAKLIKPMAIDANDSHRRVVLRKKSIRLRSLIFCASIPTTRYNKQVKPAGQPKVGKLFTWISVDGQLWTFCNA